MNASYYPKLNFLDSNSPKFPDKVKRDFAIGEIQSILAKIAERKKSSKMSSLKYQRRKLSCRPAKAVGKESQTPSSNMTDPNESLISDIGLNTGKATLLQRS